MSSDEIRLINCINICIRSGGLGCSFVTPFTGAEGVEGGPFTGRGGIEGATVGIGVGGEVVSMVRNEVRNPIRVLTVTPPFLITATSISLAALVSNDPIQSAAFPDGYDGGDVYLDYNQTGLEKLFLIRTKIGIIIEINEQ